MNILVAALLCVSPVSDVTTIVDGVTIRGSIVYQLPASCTKILGGPTLVELPAAVAPPETRAAAPETRKEAVPVKKAAKPKAKKKRPRGSCKPGRTRNSRGICGRWG